MTFLLQLFSYNVMTWLVFTAIAFCTARYLPLWCIPVGHVVVAIIIYWQDFTWVQTAMRKPDWNGTPDLDMIFMFGLVLRVLLINTVLLPLTALGAWLRRRQHRLTPRSLTPPV